MSKTLVNWAVALGVALALLGLLAVSEHSARLIAAGPGQFTKPELPPAESALNPAEPRPGVTLTH